MNMLALFKKINEEYIQAVARIDIYSMPNFSSEVVLAVAVMLIYIYLHFEISHINKKMLRLKPNAVYCEKGSISKGSGGTSVTHYHEVFAAVRGNSSTTIAYKRTGKNFTNSNTSQMGWVLPTNPKGCGRRAYVEKKQYSDHLVNLTPEQFVKIDKERKMREKEMDNYMTSLSTLCKNVLKRKYSSRTLSRQVENARESLQCNKMSLEGKYLGFKTDAMTRSLFGMLEQMITNSSLKNPLPFKGDITTLALDVADLSTDTHYFSKDVGRWDATNSSSCITDCTDETDSVLDKSEKGDAWDTDEIQKVSWH